jgi:hypothetical protein
MFERPGKYRGCKKNFGLRANGQAKCPEKNGGIENNDTRYPL